MALLLPALLLAAALPAGAQGPARLPFSALKLPPSITKPLLQNLLQRFVDQVYLKGFRHLGDERDFDHGHLLFAPRSDKLVAILYHTQELAYYQEPGSPFGFLNPTGRNWLQFADGRVQNAASFVLKAFPKTPAWDWFVAGELPALKAHHTIVERMLDPALIGADTESSVQWVFTRSPCAAAPVPNGNEIEVQVPGEGKVCLDLSRS